MLSFMSDGGMLMWPILIAGVFIILAAARNHITHTEGFFDPQRMARAIFVISIGWCAMGLRMVCGAAMTDAPPRIFVIGIGEALTPAILGLAIVGIVGVIGALSKSSLARS